MNNLLPTGIEPLKLADGTLISPIDGSVYKEPIDEYIEVPTHNEVREHIIATRKRIHDLPVPPREMNTISLVLMYTVFGLSPDDISIVLQLEVNQITSIQTSSVYKEVHDNFIDTIIESDENVIRNIFSAQSLTAANKVSTLINSDNETLALNAAKDILDRAGHRPADVVNHKHMMEGGLTIVHVNRRDDDKIPLVDITPDKM